jgi:hypothetical protein
MLRNKWVSPPALVVISSRRLLLAFQYTKNDHIWTTEEYMAFLHNEIHPPQVICNRVYNHEDWESYNGRQIYNPITQTKKTETSIYIMLLRMKALELGWPMHKFPTIWSCDQWENNVHSEDTCSLENKWHGKGTISLPERYNHLVGRDTPTKIKAACLREEKIAACDRFKIGCD